jgi:hypothetical protein
MGNKVHDRLGRQAFQNTAMMILINI